MFMPAGDGDFLHVHPPGVQVVASVLRQRSLAAVAQRRVCGGIELGGADPGIGSGLAGFVSVWGAGLTALAHELDLLGGELGSSARAVVEVDRAGAR
jgi:hypothetical protein